MANDYLKKEKKEMIQDLVNVFSPMTDKATKSYVKLVYESCFGLIIKDKPYVREAMSLAKIMTAQHLEEIIKKDAGIVPADEVAPGSTAETEISENSIPGKIVSEPVQRTKRKFVP